MGLEYSLQAGTATGNDGSVATRSKHTEGYGLGKTVGYDALTLVYVAERDNKP